MTTSESFISRRNLLIALSSCTLATTSGCSATRPKSVDQSRYQLPEIPTTERWVKQDDIRIPLEIATLGAYSAGEIYTDEQLKRSLEVLPGEIDQPIAAFFAAQVNLFQAGFGGDLLYGFADSHRVLDQAEPKIRQKLRRQFNLKNVEESPPDGSKPRRATAHKELTGTFTIQRTRDVELENGQTERVNLIGSIPIRILLSCWQVTDSEDLLISGGAYPESSIVVLQGPLTSARGIGIDVTVDVDFGFNPTSIRERIVRLVSEVTTN